MSYTGHKACQPKHYREDLVGEALDVLENSHGIKREHLFLQTKYTQALDQELAQLIYPLTGSLLSVVKIDPCFCLMIRLHRFRIKF